MISITNATVLAVFIAGPLEYSAGLASYLPNSLFAIKKAMAAGITDNPPSQQQHTNPAIERM